ncbi:MAG TPA: hypothetical protein VMS12_04400 [Thermoanaerobaculia bacterium]|nr:hypothetical protein [Thermoanaerobaculia bacterium]
MKSLQALAACLCLILIASCGPAEEEPSTMTAAQETATAAPAVPPDSGEAKKLIADSAAFSDYQFTNASYSLPLKRSRFNEVTRKGAEELRAAGWIRFEGDDVVLEPKAETDRRWLVRPNGFVDIVPIAKKELTEVSSIVPQADGNLKANLCWQWIPNEIGSAFKSGLVRERIDAMHCAIADLQPAEDAGWEVLLVEPAPTATEP